MTDRIDGLRYDTYGAPCWHCKHKRSDKYHLFNNTCDAFPGGVPDKILDGAKHDKPFPGQKNEIVFEPVEEER